MSNPWDDYAAPVEEASPWDDYAAPVEATIAAPTDAEQDNPLVRGTRAVTSSVGLYKHLAAGDYEAGATNLAEQARYNKANPGSEASVGLQKAWKKGDGILGGLSEVNAEMVRDMEAQDTITGKMGSALDNFQAMGSGIVAQTPNAVPPMVGLFGGAGAGVLVSPSLGPVAPAAPIVGGWAGASAGNAIVGTSEAAMRQLEGAGIDPEDTAAVVEYLTAHGGDILGETNVKGAVIGLVDTATMGVSHLILSAPAKHATSRALTTLGVDFADKKAVAAATKSPAFKDLIAKDTILAAENAGAKNLARTGAVSLLEPGGEFTGEYGGSYVATGEADAKDAFLEAVSSAGQSVGTVAIQKSYSGTKNQLSNKNGSEDLLSPEGAAVEDAIEAARVEDEASPQSDRAGVDKVVVEELKAMGADDALPEARPTPTAESAHDTELKIMEISKKALAEGKITQQQFNQATEKYKMGYPEAYNAAMGTATAPAAAPAAGLVAEPTPEVAAIAAAKEQEAHAAEAAKVEQAAQAQAAQEQEVQHHEAKRKVAFSLYQGTTDAQGRRVFAGETFPNTAIGTEQLNAALDKVLEKHQGSSDAAILRAIGTAGYAGKGEVTAGTLNKAKKILQIPAGVTVSDEDMIEHVQAAYSNIKSGKSGQADFDLLNELHKGLTGQELAVPEALEPKATKSASAAQSPTTPPLEENGQVDEQPAPAAKVVPKKKGAAKRVAPTPTNDEERIAAGWVKTTSFNEDGSQSESWAPPKGKANRGVKGGKGAETSTEFKDLGDAKQLVQDFMGWDANGERDEAVKPMTLANLSKKHTGSTETIRTKLAALGYTEQLRQEQGAAIAATETDEEFVQDANTGETTTTALSDEFDNGDMHQEYGNVGESDVASGALSVQKGVGAVGDVDAGTKWESKLKTLRARRAEIHRSPNLKPDERARQIARTLYPGKDGWTDGELSAAWEHHITAGEESKLTDSLATEIATEMVRRTRAIGPRAKGGITSAGVAEKETTTDAQKEAQSAEIKASEGKYSEANERRAAAALKELVSGDAQISRAAYDTLRDSLGGTLEFDALSPVDQLDWARRLSNLLQQDFAGVQEQEEAAINLYTSFTPNEEVTNEVQAEQVTESEAGPAAEKDAQPAEDGSGTGDTESAPTAVQPDASKVAVTTKRKRKIVAPEGGYSPAFVGQQVTNPSSVGEVRMAAAGTVSNPAKHLQVYATVADVPAVDRAVFDDGRAATYIPEKGYAIIVADRIEKGDALGVFLHEVGVHAAIPEGTITKLAERVNSWASGKSGGTFERGWAERAIKDVNTNEKKRTDRGLPKYTPMQRAHEEVALFAQMMVNPKQGGLEVAAFERSLPPAARTWFQTLKEALSKAMRALFLNPDKFTPQNFVDVVAGHAAKLYAGETTANTAETFAGEAPAYTMVGRVQEALSDATVDSRSTVNKTLMGLRTLTQLVDFAKDINPAIVKYQAVARSMGSMAKEWVQYAARIDVKWASVKDKDALHVVMREATRERFDPSLNLKAVSRVQDAIQEQYNKLSAEAEVVFVEARKHYEAARVEDQNITLQVLRDSFKDRIERAEEQAKSADKELAAKGANLAEEYKAKLEAQEKELSKEYAKVKGPYFPLMRIGDYYIVAKSRELAALEAIADPSAAEKSRIARMRKDPKHYVTKAFDSQGAAVKAARNLSKTLPVQKVNKVVDDEAQSKILSAAGLGDVEQYIAAEFDKDTARRIKTAMADLYYQSLPSHHALKQEMKREGIHGEEKDMRRVFATSSLRKAHYLSRLKYADQMRGALRDMKAYGKQNGVNATLVYEEINTRAKLAAEFVDTPIADKIATVSYLAHLGANPAFILTNMSQVPMITMPWLAARSSTVSTTAAVGRAYANTTKILASSYKEQGWRAELDWSKLYKDGSEESAMLQALLEMNLLDITIEHDLGAVANLKSHLLGDALKMGNLPVHITELANRSVTALAAYDLARNHNKMSPKDAIQFAAKAVSETQLDYSALNTPRLMTTAFGLNSRALAKFAMQFRKYQQGMLWLICKSIKDGVSGKDAKTRSEARRTLLGLAVSTQLMAGAVGLPMVGSVFWLASLLGGMDDEDEEDFDVEAEFRSWLEDEFGVEVATVISKGIPAGVFGVDLSKRVGLGDIATPLPFARDGKNARETIKESLLAAMGAPMGTIMDTVDGAALMADGDVLRGVEKIVPLMMAKNLLKAARYDERGLTQSNGEVIPVEFEPEDIFVVGAGFAPEKVSRYYEKNSKARKAETDLTDVKKSLLRKAATLRMNGEQDDDLNEEIADFNERNPDSRITVGSIYQEVNRRKANLRTRDADGVSQN